MAEQNVLTFIFYKSKSPKYIDAVYLAKQFANCIENEKRTEVYIPVDEIFQKMPKIEKLFSAVESLKNTDVSFNGKNLVNTHIYNMAAMVRCIKKCSKSPSEKNYCNNDSGWGCKFLSNMPRNIPETYYDFIRPPFHWFNLGYFEGKNWVISKNLIKQKLQEEAEEKFIIICPHFNYANFENILNLFPDKIDTENCSEWCIEEQEIETGDKKKIGFLQYKKISAEMEKSNKPIDVGNPHDPDWVAIKGEISRLLKTGVAESTENIHHEIPSFKEYFANRSMMNNSQSGFYQKVEKSLKKVEFIDVNGNISYLFVFLYELLENRKKIGLTKLYELLILYSELYSKEAKVSYYSRKWAYDCLLEQGRYDEFLEKTEPEDLTKEPVTPPATRINLQNHRGMKIDSCDISLLVTHKKSEFTKKHPALYKKFIFKAYNEFSENKNGWEEYFRLCNCVPTSKFEKRIRLYLGSAIEHDIQIDNAVFHWNVMSDRKIKEDFFPLNRIAENNARAEIGIPKIGEGWISETILYHKIREAFQETPVIQHGRPEWLGGQHLDIWMPDRRIAIEYQGAQHFQAVGLFGGEEGLTRTQQRDERKKALCERNKVSLILVEEGYVIENVIAQIKTAKPGSL